MIKEIACEITREIKGSLQNLDEVSLENLFSELHGANRIFFQSTGRSKLALMYFAMRMMHIGYRVHLVGDYTCPAIHPGDVLFILCADGNTSVSLEMAKKCKQIGGIRIVLVTAAAESAIGELADLTIFLPCPAKNVQSERKTIQPYNSLFEQTFLFAIDAGMICYFNERLGRPLDGDIPLHANLE